MTSTDDDYLKSTDDDYLKLIDSPRVSAQTRKVLHARLAPDDPSYQPMALTPSELITLREVLGRIIPQHPAEGMPEIDLASRLDTQLTQAKGDGWRYASLPNDVEAYRTGLSLLEEFSSRLSAVPFHRLAAPAQDGLLDAIATGRLQSPKLNLKRWFEDLRADAVQLYVSHPGTLARMGYSGIADEPDGFVQIGIGEREPWEPTSR